MKTQITLGLMTSFCLGLLTPSANAQFPGDFFFSNPSVSVPVDGEVQLDVQVFTGTTPLGLANYALVFDNTELEVIRSDAGTATTGGDQFLTRATDTGLAHMFIGGTSDDRPFGIVDLEHLLVRPLVPAGSTIQIQLIPVELLDPFGVSPFGNSSGFGAEILVTSQASLTIGGPQVPGFGASSTDPATGSPMTQQVVPTSDQLSRAALLRRKGMPIELAMPRWTSSGYQEQRVRFFAPDPRAISDLPLSPSGLKRN